MSGTENREKAGERPKAKKINFFWKSQYKVLNVIWVILHLSVVPFVLELFVWSMRHAFAAWRRRKENRRIVPEGYSSLNMTGKIKKELTLEQGLKQLTDGEVQELERDATAAAFFLERDDLSPYEIDVYATVAYCHRAQCLAKIDRGYLYDSAMRNHQGSTQVLSSRLIHLLTVEQIEKVFEKYKKRLGEGGSPDEQIVLQVTEATKLKKEKQSKGTGPLFYEKYEAIQFLQKPPDAKNYQEYAEVAYQWRGEGNAMIVAKHLLDAATNNVEAGKYVLISETLQSILSKASLFEDFLTVFRRKFGTADEIDVPVKLPNGKSVEVPQREKTWLTEDVFLEEESSDDEDDSTNKLG